MTQSQSEWLYCPFAHPIMVRQFDCECANEVTRRDGPAIACQRAMSHADCQLWFERVMKATLAAQEMELDLTKIPSSLLKKIQFGSILSLQRVQKSTKDSDKSESAGDLAQVPNVNAVVQAVKTESDIWSSVDLQFIVEYIESFQLQRRRNAHKSR